MRREARRDFYVQLSCHCNRRCARISRAFLAFRCSCAKVWRNASRGNLAREYLRLPRHRFFAGLTGPDGRFLVNPTIRQFFMIGICGGYTTFSSFSLQTLTLARDGEFLFATLNIVSSVILCLLAVWLGDYLAMHLNQR